MNAGQVGAAAHPLLALGMIPQRTDHLPTVAMIGRAKQPARQRSAPDDAGLIGTAGLQRPDARRAPWERAAPHIVLFETLGLRRIGRGRNRFPTLWRQTVHLDAEVTVVERHKMVAASGIGQRETDIVAQEVHLIYLPISVLAPDPKRPLASRNQDG